MRAARTRLYRLVSSSRSCQRPRRRSSWCATARPSGARACAIRAEPTFRSPRKAATRRRSSPRAYVNGTSHSCSRVRGNGHERRRSSPVLASRRRSTTTCASWTTATTKVGRPLRSGRNVRAGRSGTDHGTVSRSRHAGERADRVIERAIAAGGPVALFGHGHELRILIARWLELPAVGGRYFTSLLQRSPFSGTNASSASCHA